MLERVVAQAITGFARILTGARAYWIGCEPDLRPRVYYANHNSHADFALLWAVLPRAMREQTRPVAAADYWSSGALRRYLIHRVFNGVLVERGGDPKAKDPLVPIVAALNAKQSVIIFPGLNFSAGSCPPLANTELKLTVSKIRMNAYILLNFSM